MTADPPRRDQPAARDEMGGTSREQETVMAKKARKRRARKKSKANHGRRPNA